jgi:biofilm protein TabA
MVLDSLAHASRYEALHPRFAEAFRFLRGVYGVPDGSREIAGRDLYVMVSTVHGKTRSEAFLESHRKYIDIHYCLESTEEIGWRALARCASIDKPYDGHTDVQTYADGPETWCIVPAGSFVIFFPEDAHAPLVANGMIRKAVIKVAV